MIEIKHKNHTIRIIDWIGNDYMNKYTGEIEYPDGQYSHFGSNTYVGILYEIKMAKKQIEEQEWLKLILVINAKL